MPCHFLEAFIIIGGLIVQKAKLISDCNRLLKDLLDGLLLDSNENKRQFIQACISGLQIHGEERKGWASLGLDGEATERMIKELEEDREESQDPEVEFSIAGAVRECGGLEIILGIIQIAYLITYKFPTFSPPNKQISKADEAVLHSRDELKFNQEQLAAVLNLLMLCCKIREHRRALLRLGALNVLLETARHAFSVDAMEPAYFDCGEPEAISSCCYQILEIISSCCLGMTSLI
ncbi:hypothetical protein RHSIM_Rhsim10G0100000 [Rhododendron simsii]|uniref:E3 ubiquitin ligase UBR4 C-terminal domain-containing protein n=1 Tax=Rhododendron simsii TaxID=118357 RepID=A0A834LBR8_RHOSS|nr:hypothetical protein RHSIM_Rhsim10G0100000 [Rhododendron simsii]